MSSGSWRCSWPTKTKKHIRERNLLKNNLVTKGQGRSGWTAALKRFPLKVQLRNIYIMGVTTFLHWSESASYHQSSEQDFDGSLMKKPSLHFMTFQVQAKKDFNFELCRFVTLGWMLINGICQLLKSLCNQRSLIRMLSKGGWGNQPRSKREKNKKKSSVSRLERKKIAILLNI